MIAYFSKGTVYCYVIIAILSLSILGCVGNFSDVVTESSQLKGGYTGIGVAIFLGGISFLFALVAGKNKTSSSL